MKCLWRALAYVAMATSWAGSAYAVSDAAILAPRPPKLLSEFGFFDDLKDRKPAAGVVNFAPITALFSDGALKDRFVYMPEGKAASYVEGEAFEFPTGSALIKSFSFPADYADASSVVSIIETRVLLKHDSGWQAWAYVWNDEQTDATLNIAGANVPVVSVAEDGAPISFTYAVPNKNQCKACHDVGGVIVPLGPKARNLHFELTFPDGTVANQLEYWQKIGILEGVPALDRIEAVPDWRDETADIDARARGWLDVNCAHCHRRTGPASNSGLFLNWSEPKGPSFGINKRPVAAGRGSGGRLFDIKPGDPDGSILVYRLESTEPGVMMPEIGRVLKDAEATVMLRRWVSSLK